MGSAVGMSVARKKQSLIRKLVLITPFSWLGGAVYSDKLAFKVFISFVRIRERLFPNFNPQSKFSFLRKSQSIEDEYTCLLYTSPSPRDGLLSRMPSSA